jgi:hypothetical protein
MKWSVAGASAFAQGGGNTAGGSSQSGGLAASKGTTGDSMAAGGDSKMMKDRYPRHDRHFEPGGALL